MKGLSGLWIGLSLTATGWSLAFGAEEWVCLMALGAALAPVLFGTVFALRLSPLARLELEIGTWIAVAVGAVASTGGATSPHVLWFVPALMLAAIKGDTRLRLETSGFSLAGYGAATLAGTAGGWVNPTDAWLLGVGYGAAILLLATAMSLKAPLIAGFPKDVSWRAMKLWGSALEPHGRTQSPATDPGPPDLKEEIEAAADRADAAERTLSTRMQFFAQTSHELRTPLNAIVGFAEMMVQQVFGALPEKYLEYARLIREGGRNLNAVVDDITDLAKIEAGKFEIAPEVVSLTDLLEEAVRFLSETAERKRVALTLDAKEDVEAFADPRAVRQIALNLISNALKFTPAGGQVTVSATESAAGSRLTVADNGVGVTPEEIRELSQAFRQGRAGRSHKGSGLGLSVVRAYVELHSGEFTISGRPERGTVVSVTFPPETGESSSGGDSRST